jgi:CTD kinase subunit alpha
MEFYTKSAIFQGRTEIDQLELIFQLCGSPNEEWQGCKDLPWYGLITFQHYERKLVKEFSNGSYGLSPEFVRLVDGLLQLDPSKRLTAQQVLKHAFFCSEPPFACEPSELPKIEGDWHEYESKVRKKKGPIAEPTQKRGDESPDYNSSQKIMV